MKSWKENDYMTKSWEENDSIEVALLANAARMHKGIKEGTFDPNYVDEEGDTPLHVTSDPQMVREIIEAGAHLNAKNPMGQTPLMEAAKHAQVEKVGILLEAGADISLRNIKDETALHLANTGEVAAALMSRGILKYLDPEELEEETSEEKWGASPHYPAMRLCRETEFRRRKEKVVKSLSKAGDQTTLEI
jgi:hypothetical protein